MIDREGLTLREAAEQIGCGAATLSRLLRGAGADNYPDTTTLLKAASWLGHSITDYDLGRERGTSSITDVEVHLRALPGLHQRDREALVAMVRAAYDAASKLRKDKR
jgi:transcriptional regulator with XRE-family HTH domain